MYSGNSQAATVSVVVLTFNRQSLAIDLVEELSRLLPQIQEIILVDNCSVPPVQLPATLNRDGIRLLRLDENLGTAGRNHGVLAAKGDIVVTLDDDISGLSLRDVERLQHLFTSDSNLAGICFKVLDEATGKQINWCHHADIDTHAETQFETDEISEGAVAFRRRFVIEAGLYPAAFFISHEGPDLAFRLWNKGYRVLYEPGIAVRHSTALGGRASWRRYYFDTRNVFWLAARNFPLAYSCKRITRQTAAMFVYSIRDGFARYWLRGVCDGLWGLRKAMRERRAPLPATMEKIRSIRRGGPSLFKVIRRRLFQSDVRI